jgi:alpha-2-macroglobulin
VRFLLNVPKGGPDLGAWYQTLEAGYARALPSVAQTSGLELTREFLNEKNQPVTTAKVGETLKLRLRVRNVNAKEQTHLALIDLLPGGFDNAPDALKPGLGSQGADYVDVREDRNLFFTGLGAGASREFMWEVRPGVAGTFAIPPAFGEAMYDRGVHGNGAAGKFTVLPRE